MTEMKKIKEWADRLGYDLVETGPLIKASPGILDRRISEADFSELLKTEPLLKLVKREDPEYILLPHHEKNLGIFFRAAEGSLLTKSYRQLSQELKSIHDYIELMAKLNYEKQDTKKDGDEEIKKD